jgi:glc operon protein GlcG
MTGRRAIGWVLLLVLALTVLPAAGDVGAQAEPVADAVAQQAGAVEPLTLAEARVIIDGATTWARIHNLAMSMAILDPAGHLISQDRMDGASYSSIRFAVGKAMAAAMLRRPTAELADWPQNEPDRWFGVMNMFPGQVYLAPGGVPLRVNGRIVGAAGASGLPRGVDDEAIEAGIAAWQQVRPGAGH